MFWVFISLALGGILKGATGAGAPLIAVPVIAMLHPEGVPFAVAIFAFPALLSSGWQAWAYRRELLPGPVPWILAGTSVVGVFLGSWLLSWLDPQLLSMLVALGVLTYVGLRLARFALSLGPGMALRLAAPTGLFAGILQGTSGISAPVTLTYLNALRLTRPAFVATVAFFFSAQSVLQVPALVLVGIMTWERFWISIAAFGVLAAFMPVGAWLGRRWSPQLFDRVILAMLGLLGIKLLLDAVMG